jgi:fructosamine-3-kinase
MDEVVLLNFRLMRFLQEQTGSNPLLGSELLSMTDINESYSKTERSQDYASKSSSRSNKSMLIEVNTIRHMSSTSSVKSFSYASKGR